MPPSLTDDKIVAVETLQYKWETLKTATKNFSNDHKIGQGGFGSVYKVLISNFIAIIKCDLQQYMIIRCNSI